MVKSWLNNTLICSNWIVREKPLTFYIVKYLCLGFKGQLQKGYKQASLPCSYNGNQY